MEIHGIPLHPLVVHAAVVFTPLAALAVALYGSMARWRPLLRWPMAGLAVVSAGACGLAWLTGRQLRDHLLAKGVQNKWIAIHNHRANILVLLVLLQFVVAAVAFLMTRPGRPLGGAAAKALPVVLVVVALVVLVSVVLTGDAGARAVWNGV